MNINNALENSHTQHTHIYAHAQQTNKFTFVAFIKRKRCRWRRPWVAGRRYRWSTGKNTHTQPHDLIFFCLYWFYFYFFYFYCFFSLLLERVFFLIFYFATKWKRNRFKKKTLGFGWKMVSCDYPENRAAKTWTGFVYFVITKTWGAEISRTRRWGELWVFFLICILSLCVCVYVCLTLSVCLTCILFSLSLSVDRFFFSFGCCHLFVDFFFFYVFFFLLLSAHIKKDALRWLSSTSVAGNFKKKRVLVSGGGGLFYVCDNLEIKTINKKKKKKKKKNRSDRWDSWVFADAIEEEGTFTHGFFFFFILFALSQSLPHITDNTPCPLYAIEGLICIVVGVCFVFFFFWVL